MRRAFANYCLGDFLHQMENSLIAVRDSPPNESLITSLASRKNLPAGCILRRPCICALSRVASHALFPFHFFWHAARRRCRSRELLFPRITRWNVNNVFRAILK